jgi:hypothetical protein
MVRYLIKAATGRQSMFDARAGHAHGICDALIRYLLMDRERAIELRED